MLKHTNHLPKISIVTPCYNSLATIEQTLKSIHDQNYPNLEHIIMDGGSTDGTIDIIREYESKISKIVSKKDKGQYFAIQEGFSYATGDILCWLNADDIFMPWTLRIVGQLFSDNNNIHWISGLPAYLNKYGLLKKIHNNISAKCQTGIRNGWYKHNGYGYLQQESMFWTKDLWTKVNGLNINYSLAADYDLWIKFASYARIYSIDIPLSAFRIHNESRSVQLENEYRNEVEKIQSSLKSLPLIFRILGNNTILNFILRLIINRKTLVIHQNMDSDLWEIINVRTSISGVSLYSLYLEYKVKQLI